MAKLGRREIYFWRFVHTVIAQIDPRPMSARTREGEEENPTNNCKHYLWANTALLPARIKAVLKANRPAANIVLSERGKRVNQTFRHLHVFGAAFMKSLFVGNTIVANAI